MGLLYSGSAADTMAIGLIATASASLGVQAPLIAGILFGMGIKGALS